MSRNIDDILSIFRVPDHPDMIFAKKKSFLGKIKKNRSILPIYR